jgi:hypothetical protein
MGHRGSAAADWERTCNSEASTLSGGALRRDLGRPTVDLLLGDVDKLAVGSLFIVEGLLKKTGAVVSPELPCPGDQGAVPRHLIMFDGLRSGDQCGVEDIFIVDFAGNVVRFFDNAIYGRAIDTTLLDDRRPRRHDGDRVDRRQRTFHAVGPTPGADLRDQAAPSGRERVDRWAGPNPTTYEEPMGIFSKDIETMDDLFVHTLRDIYYAENQILKALPDMIEKAPCISNTCSSLLTWFRVSPRWV